MKYVHFFIICFTCLTLTKPNPLDTININLNIADKKQNGIQGSRQKDISDYQIFDYQGTSDCHTTEWSICSSWKKIRVTTCGNSQNIEELSCVPEDCVKEDNFAYWGEALDNMLTKNGEEECANWCGKIDTCEFWVFQKSSNLCLLKTHNYDRRNNNMYISGSKECAKNTPSEISLGTAHCLFNGEGTGKVVGKVIIERHKNEEHPDVTHFRGEVSGLSPGLHGFHIHEKGDLGDNCKQAGGHFNPHGVNHGGKDAKERHVGDLGNLEAGEDGIMKINFADHMVQLIGPHSIFGKAIVIHEGEDDLGLGGNKGSITTGNAGPRAGCCIIQ